jgi:hypothetical protein
MIEKRMFWLKHDIPLRTCILTLLLIVLASGLAEFSMGRQIWGIHGTPGIWSGDIWSANNSQFLTDPYTLTHISHGILFYALLTLLFPTSPIWTRLILAGIVEGVWEVVENTSFVINRYRMETISLNYYGDSIVNSMADMIACYVGFLLASRLPKAATIALLAALEIVLLVWTRDNLTLNIVMLFYPSSAIRAWQMAP